MDELDRGAQVELEHTDDINTARKIAKDHLAEDPLYYTKLDIMENQPWVYHLGRALVPFASNPNGWWLLGALGAAWGGFYGFKRGKALTGQTELSTIVWWGLCGAVLPIPTISVMMVLPPEQKI